MNGASLSVHSQHSRIVNRQELAMTPTPAGTWSFKPVPHSELVDVISNRLDARGWGISREQLAVSPNGMQLFGVMDLNNGDGGMSSALGFRAANDKSLAIQLVAGARVFVCDNLAMSGNSVLLKRKHTRGLSLAYEIDRGLEKVFEYMRRLNDSVTRINGVDLSDPEAKALIFDIFAQGILSTSLFEGVASNYFKAEARDLVDCKPRTAWGVHNACTREIKALTPGPAFKATQALGRFLGLGSEVATVN